MITLILCGTPWCPTATLQSALEAAGVAPAAPAPSVSIANITVWHDRLFASQPKPLVATVLPGKAWELAASQIVLANWDQTLWGWADNRSTWLLDFWRDFDASTRFVLLHTPLETALVRAMTDTTGDDGLDPALIIDQWCAHQTELLRFFHRNRSRCVLLHAEQALANPAGLILALNQAFQLNLSAPPNPATGTASVNPLDLWLAQQIAGTHPAALALAQDMLASVLPWPAMDSTAGPAALTIQPPAGPSAAFAQLRELRRLQATLSKLAADYKTLQQKLTQESSAKTQAQAERDAMAQAKAKAQADAQALAQQQHNQAKSELQQENELLLLQLHQVQEELEHYFLQHQQGQQTNQQLEDRLARLFARYPEHCEWERIDPVADLATQPSWRISGLLAGGRNVPTIEVSLQTVHGAPVLLLHPPAQPESSALLYWPRAASVSAKDPLQTLHLQPDAAAGSLEAATLRRLTPTDLHLLQTICSALIQGLPATQPERAELLVQLQTLQKALTQLPATWRFDTVRLKHQQVNPDYENLWFALQNASYGSRHWPEFEFRLSASLIKRGQFSVHPKLEFPLPTNGAKQFENWFEESEDDRGPKFELRFDIKATAMDIIAWQALNTADQAQALAMVAQLPALLTRLQQQGTAIARPWADWQGLASGIQHTLQTCLGLPSDIFARA